MLDKKNLEAELHEINNKIELIKEQLTENIQWEEMVDATINLKELTELKAQQDLFKNTLEKGDKKDDRN